MTATATTGIVTRTSPGNEGQAAVEHQSGALTFTDTSVRTVQTNKRHCESPSVIMLRVRISGLK